MTQHQKPHDENPEPLPYTRRYDLARLPEAGAEIALIPNEAERAAIAKWVEIESLQAFQAKVTLTKLGGSHVRYDVKFDAELIQACVVTLDPVPAKLSGQLRRDFLLGDGPRRAARTAKSEADKAPLPPSHEVSLDSDNEEGPEMLEGSMLDLAAPALEEFALSINPYPRSPGAEFAATEEAGKKEAESRENPFAVLQKLKKPQ